MSRGPVQTRLFARHDSEGRQVSTRMLMVFEGRAFLFSSEGNTVTYDTEDAALREVERCGYIAVRAFERPPPPLPGTWRKCLACGIAKDMAVREIYPYPDDGIVDDEPIDPLFDIDCQGHDWRVTTVCHHCLHRLDPDLWISEEGWQSLNPVTPFEQLPKKDEHQRGGP